MSVYCGACNRRHDCSVCPICHGLGERAKGPAYSYGPDKASPVVVDMTGDPGYWTADEYRKCAQDLRLYGCAFMQNGKRVDPGDVFLPPKMDAP